MVEYEKGPRWASRASHCNYANHFLHSPYPHPLLLGRGGYRGRERKQQQQLQCYLSGVCHSHLRLIFIANTSL